MCLRGHCLHSSGFNYGYCLTLEAKRISCNNGVDLYWLTWTFYRHVWCNNLWAYVRVDFYYYYTTDWRIFWYNNNVEWNAWLILMFCIEDSFNQLILEIIFIEKVLRYHISSASVWQSIEDLQYEITVW